MKKNTHIPTFDELKKKLIELKEETDTYYEDYQHATINKINNGLHPNMFITEFIMDGENSDFGLKIGLKNVLGYENEEFTFQSLVKKGALGVDDDPYIIHPDDLEHTIRYGHIAYQLLFSPESRGTIYEFAPMRDCYCVYFRAKKKNGDWVWLERVCYLYRVDEEGIPYSHLDFWTMSRVSKGSEFVEYDFFYKNARNERLNELFYELNCQYLGIEFSLAEREILKFYEEGATRKEIVVILNERLKEDHAYRQIFKEKHIIQSSTVKAYYDSMKKKALLFLEDRGEERLSGRIKLLNFAKRFGLY
ncbi:MAG: hypothetical protein AB8B69_00765 [Chitinophagales bacterium]